MISIGSYGTGRSIKTLLITTLVVYIFQIIFQIVPWLSTLLLKWGSLIPHSAFTQWQIWRFITYMFLHDPNSPLHILFNMLMLWMFGVEIEQLWGARRFTLFYLICGAGSGLFSFFSLFNYTASITPVIGASGAVLGVMTIYAWYFPHRQVLLFFVLPVNIRFVVLGAAIISLSGIFASRGIISHITHLGGIIVALIYIKLHPIITEWYHNIVSGLKESENRRKKAAKLAEERYFEQNIDPILEKISKQGMQSLTAREKKVLKEASKNNRDRLKKGPIIPLDPFR